ncbi:MAG: hypothetical protein EP332_12710 [Bacteroidetes bacterium]|nr:MAG: hypothetical protein EP332_12710 [Bacteroidota bacterium]
MTHKKLANPHNVRAKDLSELFDWSLSTANRKMAEIKREFQIVKPHLVTLDHIAEFFGINPELIRIT